MDINLSNLPRVSSRRVVGWVFLLLLAAFVTLNVERVLETIGWDKILVIVFGLSNGGEWMESAADINPLIWSWFPFFAGGTVMFILPPAIRWAWAYSAPAIQGVYSWLYSRSQEQAIFRQQIGVLSRHYKQGLDLINRWTDTYSWNADWDLWNLRLSSYYQKISPELCLAMEVDWSDIKTSDVTQAYVSKQVMQKRLASLQEYIRGHLKQ